MDLFQSILAPSLKVEIIFIHMIEGISIFKQILPSPQTKKEKKKEEGLFVDLHAWVPCEQL